MRIKISGFTLIELIVILMVIGILAIAAAPRFADQSIYDSRGFYDETLTILRYAQKTAVAQRRVVCATFISTKVTLHVAPTFGATCSTNLTSPNGNTPYQVVAHGSAQFTTFPASLSFNPDGSVNAAATIQISGASSAITVVQGTGYVY
jgi:MSHA pilin protein MshC